MKPTLFKSDKSSSINKNPFEQFHKEQGERNP
jgi:hypothetical protein